MNIAKHLTNTATIFTESFNVSLMGLDQSFILQENIFKNTFSDSNQIVKYLQWAQEATVTLSPGYASKERSTLKIRL